jgi:hypothetical protein
MSIVKALCSYGGIEPRHSNLYFTSGNLLPRIVLTKCTLVNLLSRSIFFFGRANSAIVFIMYSGTVVSHHLEDNCQEVHLLCDSNLQFSITARWLACVHCTRWRWGFCSNDFCSKNFCTKNFCSKIFCSEYLCSNHFCSNCFCSNHFCSNNFCSNNLRFNNFSS